jgi:hypothetical protein
MKTFFAAFALIAALPAAAPAQFKPAQDHAHHQDMDHGKEHKDCCEHKTADGKPMDCCAKAMKDGKKMACCDKHDGKGQHAGHNMKH